MINPFKTKKILIIGTERTIRIEIPFLRKIRFITEKSAFIETGNIKGQVYDGLVVDEAVKMNKKTKHYLGVDYAKEKNG